MSKATTQTRPKAAPEKFVAKRAIAAKTFAFTNKPGAKRGGVVPPTGPGVRVKTLRLHPTFEAVLVILKGVLRKPLNKMVNEAVGEYIERRAAQAESQLATTLDELKAYRRADPEFSAARKAFIDGEASFGKADPLEGRVVMPISRPVLDALLDMGVHVDKSRRDDVVPGVDGAQRLRRRATGDGRDAPTLDGHMAAEPRVAGAVQYAGVRDDEVKGAVRCSLRRRRCRDGRGTSAEDCSDGGKEGARVHRAIGCRPMQEAVGHPAAPFV